MIKDPIHGFIDFHGDFEVSLIELLGDPFFQRLRKIKQLGFSDHLFPSATHTRFSHSLGVYAIAKRMLAIVEPDVTDGNWSQKGKACLAAALLHDIGHGMFSHAFENAIALFVKGNNELDADTIKELERAVDHEKMSDRIIKESSISKILKDIGGTDFPDEVATIISKKNGSNIYTSIISSQLDADRLDYMLRDPYFAGVSSGGIDLDWIIRNLKVNEEKTFFYFDSKAFISVEQFCVTLFHLYPTIYYHKKTRALEHMFSKMLQNIFQLVLENNTPNTGLDANHPIVSFFKKPSNLDTVKALDDTVLWGSLHSLLIAPDENLRNLASNISARCFDTHIDVWNLGEKVALDLEISASERVNVLNSACKCAIESVEKTMDFKAKGIFHDSGERKIYKKPSQRQGGPDQINIKVGENYLDAYHISPIVASSANFYFHRLYFNQTECVDEKLLCNKLISALEDNIGGVQASH